MSNHAWKLQDAKNHFSELVEKSLSEGPQLITRRGKPTSVLISFDAYRKQSNSKASFLKLCSNFTDTEHNLVITRNKFASRDISL